MTTTISELTWQSSLFARSVDFAASLDRLSPRAAYQEVLWRRATLVDIRPAAQRATEGAVAPELAAVPIEHDQLVCRLDPRSHARLPIAAPGLRVILLCQEGRASQAAANALVRLGIRQATDIAGGFAAWRSLGLPVAA